jgi:hypothetical protein
LNTAAATPTEPGTTPAAPLVDSDYAWLPEKFRKTEGSGGFDLSASAKQMAESYTALEKRVGSGDIPPAAADGYKVEIDGIDWAEMQKAPGVAEALGEAHKLGFTNQQMQFMIRELANAQPSQAERTAGMTEQEAAAALREVWKSPAEYQRNVVAALNTVNNLVGKDDAQGFMNKYGNDPVVLQLLAKVGTEMGEDRLTYVGQPVASAESIDALMQSPAYFDQNHADHKRVKATVSQYFSRTYGNDPIV